MGVGPIALSTGADMAVGTPEAEKWSFSWGHTARSIGAPSSPSPRLPSLRQWCPVTPMVIGNWTVGLVSSDPQIACDLGVGGPKFKSHLCL